VLVSVVLYSKICVDVIIIYSIHALLVGNNTFKDSRACLASSFLFWVSSLSVPLLLTCGLYEHSAYHLRY
jgi:hypothetical protein